MTLDGRTLTGFLAALGLLRVLNEELGVPTTLSFDETGTARISGEGVRAFPGVPDEVWLEGVPAGRTARRWWFSIFSDLTGERTVTPFITGDPRAFFAEPLRAAREDPARLPEWLATMALPLLRFTGDSATLWPRGLAWPLWSRPLDPAAVVVLLEHPALRPFTVDSELMVNQERWGLLGVFAMWTPAGPLRSPGS